MIKQLWKKYKAKKELKKKLKKNNPENPNTNFILKCYEKLL